MKVLIIAQTPPPYHGQAVMQEALVEAPWNWCTKKHIRLEYSQTIDDVGRFRIGKIAKLFRVVLSVFKERLKGRIDILYYPPAGPHKIPFYRDFLTLILTRWCARKVIFQFHAGNFDGLLGILNPPEKVMASFAYGRPEAAIVLLPLLEEEVRWIEPRRTFVVPNGIEDRYEIFRKKTDRDPRSILFVGSMSEKKGIMVCLEAARFLREMDVRFRFVFVGGWPSPLEQQAAEEFTRRNGLSECIFTGTQFGEVKWEHYAKAGIFCLPTFDTEAMPMSILEAMMMSLPVVTTRWRGLPQMVNEGVDGFLAPARDSSALADKLAFLLRDPSKGEEMGRRGREKYLKEYTIEKHLARMEEVFKTVATA